MAFDVEMYADHRDCEKTQEWLRDQIAALQAENARLREAFMTAITDDALRREMAETLARKLYWNTHAAFELADALLAGPVGKHIAALRASPDPGSAPAEGWRDIASVPLGVEILVRGGRHPFGKAERGLGVACIDDLEDLYRPDGSLRPTSPTMWHPAPPPPAEPTRDTQEGEKP